MSDFKQGLKVEENNIFGKPESKFRIEMDAYRDHVNENLRGFLCFMEGINNAINLLEDEFIMSNIEFRARIKDAMSSIKTTDFKLLDDIFGFEVDTPNETDKELLMLLINTTLDDIICKREKKHNKTNGYKAYHRVGSLTDKQAKQIFENFEDYVLHAETITLADQYRNTTRKEQQDIPKEELFETVYMYPELRKLIEEKNLSKSTIEAIKKARECIYEGIKGIQLKDIPVVEFQFKTDDVAEEAKFGTASHVGYKPVDRQEIKSDYIENKLIRGIHYPFKFQRANGKMILQPAYLTLFEMYPFLKEDIVKHRRTNPKSYNMHFAIVFPALKPYIRKLARIEPYHITKNTNRYSIWEILKARTINPDYIIPRYSKTNSKEGEQK